MRKDVDRLRELGFVATCNPMGAGKWRDEYSETLRGRKVFIIPDNDSEGDNHAVKVASSLNGIAAEVRILHLPDLPSKGDVSDYLSVGNSAADLQELIDNTPAWQPDAEWEVPLLLDTIDPPPFPMEALSPLVRTFVDSVASSLQVPPDLPGSLALGVVASATQGRYRVRVNADWTEQLSQYIILVLQSGERNSQAFRKVTKPLRDAEKALIESSREGVAQSQAQLDVLEQRLRRNKQDAAKAHRGEQDVLMADVNATAEEIVQFNLVTEPRLLADDVTPEAVTRLLSEQGGVMALMSTEGGIFEILAGRYSGSINIDTFLKAHTGDPIIVDRIGRPSLYIPSPRLTMVLTVQPSVVRDLADKPGFRGRGLLARCWFSVPKSMVGYRDTEETLIPSEVTDSWAKLVNSILALPSTPGETRDLTLSSGAKSLLNEYRAVVEEKLRPGAELSDIRD